MKMKPLLCTLALFTMLAPALAQTESPFDQTPPAKPKAVTMKSGILVTPIIVPDDDLRSILDVKMWHFSIKAPAHSTAPVPRLELRVPGQPPQLFGFMDGFISNENSDFLIGIAPIGGTSLSKAAKWKIFYRTRSDATSQFTASASDEEDNPIKGLNFMIARYNAGTGYALPNPNGDIPLISLYKFPAKRPGAPIRVAELVLTFTATKPAKP
ncbi:MAG TPA: hypothetical protein VF627_04330 [Abditibacterium sp.]|jgi:hypothetical protein